MGVRILLDKVYYVKDNGVFEEGFVYIDENTIGDLGREPPVEYSLSELHYTFDKKAVVIHGYSVALTPSLYPFRGITGKHDLSVFSREEVKGFIKAAFYELLANGITLPVIYNESVEYIQLAIDVAKTLSIPVAIMGDQNLLHSYGNIIDDQSIYGIKVDSDLPRERICYDEISPNCSIVYLKNTINVNALLSYALRKYEFTDVIRVLANPYKILGLDSGFIEKNARAHITIYDARKPLKAPLLKHAPQTILARGYLPDIVIVDGDIVVEQGLVYIVNEVEVAKALDVIYNKW